MNYRFVLILTCYICGLLALAGLAGGDSPAEAFMGFLLYLALLWLGIAVGAPLYAFGRSLTESAHVAVQVIAAGMSALLSSFIAWLGVFYLASFFAFAESGPQWDFSNRRTEIQRLLLRVCMSWPAYPASQAFYSAQASATSASSPVDTPAVIETDISPQPSLSA